MNRIKLAALWSLGKLLAVSVFAATSLGSCGAVYLGASAVLYPAQTEFAEGVTPAQFLVAVENRQAWASEPAFDIVRLDRAASLLANKPEAFRLSLKQYWSYTGDPWGFEVIEESAAHQVIAVHHRNTQGIDTKYRVEGGRITPLSYKSDGGVGLAMLLLPVFLFCLWLGLVAARRATRGLAPVLDTLRDG